jgi:hypothetical protein
MARIYHNAGPCGREWTELRTWALNIGSINPTIGFCIGPSKSVELNVDQLTDLHTQIGNFLSTCRPALPRVVPMIEGEL